MDRITESLLQEFSAENTLENLPDDKRFEHFATYVTVRRHFSETFDTSDVVTGGGADTGIDAIAIIVNGTLITEPDTLEELAQGTDNLDVTFIFVQAEQTSSFSASKIGTFGFGVQDFFKINPSMPRNGQVINFAEIMSSIYDRSSKFKRGNPSCRLYYVTTGKWTGDPVLEARRQATIADLQNSGQFGDVEFTCMGADIIQKLYNQTKNAIAREFTFANRVDIPEMPGVTEAYLGFLPVSQFLPLVRDEGGDIIRTIFYDNVRDFQAYNDVNTEMQATLQAEYKSRFVLMNNGITIITRELRKTGSKFNIEDYQIVNGCQTSHVIFDNRCDLDDTVQIPVRLISTQDESVIESIIRATNRQTEVKQEQFAAITDFAKKLEQFFQTYPPAWRLYYERRPCQYDRLSIERTRIITQPNMVRAFAAVFLAEPHRTSRSYKSLTDRLGEEIFASTHRLEPYYAAAYALYRLEYFFRTYKVDTKYKPARFHILLALRYLIGISALPPMSSNEAGRLDKKMAESLADAGRAEELYADAVDAIDLVANGNIDRDNIHTQTFTEYLMKHLEAQTVK